MPRTSKTAPEPAEDDEARALVTSLAHATAEFCACRLNRTDATLLLRVDLQGMALEEVAAGLSLSPGEARSRLARARDLAAMELVACLRATGDERPCRCGCRKTGKPERTA